MIGPRTFKWAAALIAETVAPTSLSHHDGSSGSGFARPPWPGVPTPQPGSHAKWTHAPFRRGTATVVFVRSASA